MAVSRFSHFVEIILISALLFSLGFLGFGLWLDAEKSRFYYADQRDSRDGRPVGQDIDGEAHGEMYWQLAQPGKQQKWLVTFTKDKGRVEYGGVDWEGRPYRPEY